MSWFARTVFCLWVLPSPFLASFPADFLFGVSTSSYQVEGAYNASGKGMSIWDTLTHNEPWLIKDGLNGDLACDSYDKYKEDVGHIKNLGFKVYRFSLSWPRIFPRGTPDFLNKEGVLYYHNLIDELLANDIEPMVTIYHWDLPQALQNDGGWLNERIVDHFGNYSDFVFQTYGSKIKWWITINEPGNVAIGYGGLDYAPALNWHGHGEYLAAHNIIKAHARAYRIYQDKYKRFGGKLSLSQVIHWYIPESNKTEDIEAAERGVQCWTGWFGHPIHTKSGDYPEILKTQVAKMSKAENIPNRLPSFSQQEIEFIKGTSDFFALNIYSAFLARSGVDPKSDNPSNLRDQEVTLTINPKWPHSASSWVYIVPEAIRMSVNWIKKNYGNTTVFITEGGFSDNGTSQNDSQRIEYYKLYFDQLDKAINEDGCPVIGYTVWSLLDNFEWNSGYTEKFGLIHVDFKSPNRTRTYKKSAVWFKNMLQNRTKLMGNNFVERN